MAKFYKYGFAALLTAVLAFIGLAAVQATTTMTLEEKLQVAKTVALTQEIDRLTSEAELQRRRTEAALEKSQSLSGREALAYMPVFKDHVEKYQDNRVLPCGRSSEALHCPRGTWEVESSWHRSISARPKWSRR